MAVLIINKTIRYGKWGTVHLERRLVICDENIDRENSVEIGIEKLAFPIGQEFR